MTNPVVQKQQPLNGERSLWAEVIRIALADATTPVLPSELVDGRTIGIRAVDRRKARAWFNSSSRDFITVCSLADLDPDAVLEYAQLAFERADNSSEVSLAA